MGGELFKSVGAKRLSLDEYKEVSNKIIDSGVLDIFEKFHLVRSYESKESHGDIDFIVTKPKINDWKKYIAEQLNCEHSKFLSEESHYLVGNAQIDLRIVPFENFDSSVFFSNYDCLGNAVGRMSRYLGLRFGYKGLVFPAYTENQQNRLEDIIVSSEPKDILEFLGLNLNDYSKGFNNKEDIFEYVTCSKYYSIECFNPINWDHATRTRNKKRKTFCEFIQYIEKYHNYSKFNFLPRERRAEYIELINIAFPKVDLVKKVNIVRENYKVNREILSRFNGSDIMEISGLKGVELGSLIKEYKNNCGDWTDFLKNITREQAIKDFKLWLRKRKNRKN